MPSPCEVDRIVADVERTMQVRNYRPRTRRRCGRWIRRFLFSVKVEDPGSLQRRDVEQFLDRLTREARLAPKSRNQATSALSFFFREVLGRDELGTLKRAKVPRRTPVVLWHGQVLSSWRSSRP